MSENILKFDNIRVNKKEFHKSDDGFKYFIGYKEGKIVKPLCLILPQMTGYIEYFESGGKNMSFVIKDYVLDKYNEIWDKIKETLNINFTAWLLMMKNT